MNILNRLTTMCLMAVLAITVFSCSDKDEEEISVEAGIVGKWKLESAEILINGQDFTAYIEELAKQMGIDPESFDMDLATIPEGASIEFKADHSAETIIVDEKTTGTWRLEEGNKLYIKSDDGHEDEYIVKSMKSTSAVLYSVIEEDTGMGTTIKTELTLNLKK